MRNPPRGLRAAVAACAGLAILAGCGGGSGSGDAAGSGHSSPASSAGGVNTGAPLMARALAAARAAGSVHIVADAKAGPSTAVYAQDCAANVGRQVVTADHGGQATVLDINGVGYVRGNATALAGFLGAPAKLARRAAGEWISFRSGQDGYEHVVSGVTLTEVLAQITLIGVSRTGAVSTVAGHRVIGLRGEVPTGFGIPAGIQGTLYVSATGAPLPVSFQASAGGGAGGEKISFSRWGERVRVSAPERSVRVTSLIPG